jgi:polysaccharide export outer membrane protein
VSVLGEVRLPGRFEFRNQVTVLDALAQAGGLTEFASGSDILILRNNHGRTEKIRFDYKRSTRFDKNEPRVLLLPGDVVVVP